MRGAQESIWRFAIVIPIALLVLAVAIGSVSSLTKENPLKPFLGTDTQTPELSDKQNPFPLNWVSHPQALISRDDKYLPSEIACEIASKIKNDFTANGCSSRQVQDSDSLGMNCQNHWCIINGGIGYFSIDKSYGSISLNDIKADLASKKCIYCEYGGNQMDFDEVCINDNLNSLGACNKPIGNSYSFFANKGCSCASTNGGWCDQCQAFCWSDHSTSCNNDDKIYWYGDELANADPYKAYDNINDLILSSINLDWKSGSGIPLNVYPNKYMYGILWNSLSNRYDLLFERVPLLKQTSTFSMADIAYDIRNTIRVNRLGNWYGQAREIEEFSYTPSNLQGGEISIGDFIQPFKTALNNEYNGVDVKHTCVGMDDCLSTQPLPITKQCKFPTPTYIPDSVPVSIKIDANIDKIKNGQTYLITIKNWIGDVTFEGSLGVSSQFCWSSYDRTIIITQETPIAITFGATPSQSGQNQGSFCMFKTGSTQDCQTSGTRTVSGFYIGDTVNFIATPAAGFEIKSFEDKDGNSYSPQDIQSGFTGANCPADAGKYTLPCSFSVKITSSAEDSTLKANFGPK